MSKVVTFFRFPREQKAILLKIVFLVPLVEMGIRTIRFKRTYSVLSYFSKRKKRENQNGRQTVLRYSNLMLVFSKTFPMLGKCLSISLSLWYLLNNQGVETALRFGTKKLDGALSAHAWIEFEGKKIDAASDQSDRFKAFPQSILEKL